MESFKSYVNYVPFLSLIHTIQKQFQQTLSFVGSGFTFPFKFFPRYLKINSLNA